MGGLPDNLSKSVIIRNIHDINENFLLILHNYTANDSMDFKVRWTHLTHQQIADKFKEININVSQKIVKQLFKKHGYVKRKSEKSLNAGYCKYRNEQFEILTIKI